MFSLIVTIIAIALLAALAAAAVYYGGNQYVEQKTSTATTAMVSAATQIESAVNLYKSDHQGAYPNNVATLVEKKYLSSAPAGTWVFYNDYVVKEGVPQKECLAANKSVGVESVPACNDPLKPDGTMCCYNVTP
jgi:type II secretory pathway pseudopilin PulG